MKEFLRELSAVGFGGLGYYLVRGAVSDRVEEAFQRGLDILRLEQRLGLDWETAFQEAVLGSPLLIDLANVTYFWAHMPLLIVLGLWIWLRHRDGWRTFRNALVISGVVGLVSYFLFPTAPPRLMPELGYIDTLIVRAAPAYQAQHVGVFVNPYAALPSLHAGWALLAGLALWRTSTHWAVRTLAVLIPLALSWSVLATANHWTLDIVAGLLICSFAWVIALWLDKRLGRLRSNSRNTKGT